MDTKQQNSTAVAAVANFSSLPDNARIKAATVLTLLAWSRTTLWRRVKDGKFPQPIRDSYNSIRWRAGDVRKYLAQA
jgi:predicted DNA-binding transcriptional regulator AlpA